MSTALDILVLVLAWLGAAFVVIASVGLIRMPDLFTRLQASSKAPTVGVALIAAGLVVHFADAGIAVRAAALVLILFVTAPVAAHVIARAGFVSGVELEPGTSVDEHWREGEGDAKRLRAPARGRRLPASRSGTE